jgi:hypothetical protein
MRTLEGKRVVSQIINLTGEPFCMYEESSGGILVLIPSTEKLPTGPHIGLNKLPSTYYVVDKNKVDRIGRKRTLTDIAVISSRGTGRGGIEVCTLTLASRPKIRLGLLRQCHCHPFFETSQPDATVHSPILKQNTEIEVQRFESRHYAEVL